MMSPLDLTLDFGPLPPLAGDAVDLFAGPGGWEALTVDALGLDVTGFEINPAAVATRNAAGLRTVPGDIRDVDPRDYRTAGQIASPPCQGFTLLGTGNGRRDSVALLAELAHVRTLADLEGAVARLSSAMADPRTLLVLEPLRWALINRPAWVAWEQVVGVAPIWQACARILRGNGYAAQAETLSTERWGVPQTRRRAILVARYGAVELPTATHSRYDTRNPSRLEPGMPGWVSLGAALDVTDPTQLKVNNQSGSPFDLTAQLSTPATAVAGRNVLGFRGANANRFNGSTKSRNDGWVLTAPQMSTVQTFPPAYPWQGNQTEVFQQIGDAVPPRFATAVLSAVTGRALTQTTQRQ